MVTKNTLKFKKTAPTCFGSHWSHPQGTMSVPSQNYIYGLAVLSKRTWSVLWRHIRACCVCACSVPCRKTALVG